MKNLSRNVSIAVLFKKKKKLHEKSSKYFMLLYTNVENLCYELYFILIL